MSKSLREFFAAIRLLAVKSGWKVLLRSHFSIFVRGWLTPIIEPVFVEYANKGFTKCDRCH